MDQLHQAFAEQDEEEGDDDEGGGVLARTYAFVLVVALDVALRGKALDRKISRMALQAAREIFSTQFV